jgi:4-amino-4-deoxy-L-arabinose transferase-like glycosyltransferase
VLLKPTRSDLSTSCSACLLLRAIAKIKTIQAEARPTKTTGADARLNRLNSAPPIRSRAAEEGNFQIPLWGVPLILLLVYVCLFSGLGALGFVGPDEPRYAAIARAMSETHDWITPRLWGTPWFEKPVLYYWTAGIAMRLFGVSEFAARLPSALAALLAVVAVAWTALRSYGVGAAWYSLLMLPTSVAMIGFCRAASPDMLFAGLLTAAMAVAVEILQTPRPGPILRVSFGFLLGAAVLAKGPAAVILAGGATLLWAGLSRQWRAPFRFLHPLVLLVFCATALPWYALCALRNPDFLRVFIWQHNFQRYLTPVFQHRQPFWFYVPVLLAASLPWFVMGISVIFTKWNQVEWQDSPAIFIFCWTAFPFLFFSISQSKLPGYVLPSVPPLFLLMVRGMGRLFASNPKMASFLVGFPGVMWVISLLALENVIRRIGHTFNVSDSRAIVLLAVGVAGGLITIRFGLTKKPMFAIAATALLIAVLLAFMNVEILPIADARISARNAARASLRLNPSGQNLMVFGLTRDWNYGMDNYFGRELPEWMPGMPMPEWLLTNAGDAAGFARLGIQFREVSRAGEPYAVLIHVLQPSEQSR